MRSAHRSRGACTYVPSPEGDGEGWWCWGGGGLVTVGGRPRWGCRGVDERKRRRGRDLGRRRNGETERRGKGGCGALTGAETPVPTSLLQREKDRKRGRRSRPVCTGHASPNRPTPNAPTPQRPTPQRPTSQRPTSQRQTPTPHRSIRIPLPLSARRKSMMSWRVMTVRRTTKASEPSTRNWPLKTMSSFSYGAVQRHLGMPSL